MKRNFCFLLQAFVIVVVKTIPLFSTQNENVNNIVKITDEEVFDKDGNELKTTPNNTSLELLRQMIEMNLDKGDTFLLKNETSEEYSDIEEDIDLNYYDEVLSSAEDTGYFLTRSLDPTKNFRSKANKDIPEVRVSTEEVVDLELSPVTVTSSSVSSLVDVQTQRVYTMSSTTYSTASSTTYSTIAHISLASTATQSSMPSSGPSTTSSSTSTAPSTVISTMSTAPSTVKSTILSSTISTVEIANEVSHSDTEEQSMSSPATTAANIFVSGSTSVNRNTSFATENGETVTLAPELQKDDTYTSEQYQDDKLPGVNGGDDNQDSWPVSSPPQSVSSPSPSSELYQEHLSVSDPVKDQDTLSVSSPPESVSSSSAPSELYQMQLPGVSEDLDTWPVLQTVGAKYSPESVKMEEEIAVTERSVVLSWQDYDKIINVIIIALGLVGLLLTLMIVWVCWRKRSKTKVRPRPGAKLYSTVPRDDLDMDASLMTNMTSSTTLRTIPDLIPASARHSAVFLIPGHSMPNINKHNIGEENIIHGISVSNVSREDNSPKQEVADVENARKRWQSDGNEMERSQENLLREKGKWKSEDWEKDQSFMVMMAKRLEVVDSRAEITEL